MQELSVTYQQLETWILLLQFRTMILKNKKAYVQAGAGIVYDSIAQNEYQRND